MDAGKLVICPTPIGNLGDMTLRGLEALRGADAVCAEDTRVTAKLLAAYDIKKRVERWDEATISKGVGAILERIAAGQVIVFCSDAGMPGVSDPGSRLVRAAQDAQVPVEVLPGPTAGVAAYVASGFTYPSFYFGGFFPRKAADRERALAKLKALDAVLVFYESPNRLVGALKAVAEALPEREVAICRELTKLHEEVVRGNARKVLEEFERRAAETSLKGEVVLVIDAPPAQEQERDTAAALDSAQGRAQELMEAGLLSKKDIVSRLQEEFGVSRNDAYEIVVCHGDV
ncbi:MAG: 16S rRNA (cytidine(1402)-2'-O)-methyltransferase [Eggerthellaceae bacterium]|nr:16S rRNA (cytidine(1402)-2'-O)-methyltransferase [Eggerthellaceae bacterium]